MNVWIVFLISLIVHVLFVAMVIIFKYLDKENEIPTTWKNGSFIYLIELGFLIVMNQKYKADILCFFFICMLLYVLIAAFVDYYTMYIYRFLNYIGIITGIICFFITENTGKYTIIATISSLLLYFLLLYILVILKAFGAGDGLLFAGIAFYLMSLDQTSNLVVLLFSHLILSYLIFYVYYFIQIFFKEKNNTTIRAFAPSIAASALMIVLLH